MKTALGSTLPAICLLALAGCCLPLNPPPRDSVASVPTIIDEYNANAQKTPYFRLEARIQATIYSKQGVSLLRYGTLVGPPNATILLARNEEAPAGPDDFTFYVREATRKVFGAGVSSLDGLYYFFYGLGDNSDAVVGRTALAGAPGVEAMPIDPLQLAAVFGMTPLPDDLSTFPTVTQRMKMDCPYAYILSVVDRQAVSGQAVVKRDMYFTWDPGKPRQLYRIVFINQRGLDVMQAELSDYKALDVSELFAPPAEPPVMPHTLKLTWLDGQTGKRSARLEISISRAHTPDLLYEEAVRFEHIVPGTLQGRARLIDAELAPQTLPAEQGGTP